MFKHLLLCVLYQPTHSPFQDGLPLRLASAEYFTAGQFWLIIEIAATPEEWPSIDKARSVVGVGGQVLGEFPLHWVELYTLRVSDKRLVPGLSYGGGRLVGELNCGGEGC